MSQEPSPATGDAASDFEAWYRVRYLNEVGRLFTRGELQEAFLAGESVPENQVPAMDYGAPTGRHWAPGYPLETTPSETLKKFEQCSFCTMPPTCAMQGCALKNAAPQAAIRPDSGGQSSDTDAPAVAAPVSVPSAMGKPIPIAEATMPMLEALKAPCRHCGKRPIDTMDFS